MTNWTNICRVCSSPGEYEIFEKIPAYLHVNLNEFLNWQKPINVMLEEATGLKCTEDDGLPNKICAICISYLKHAATFREQCINNSLGLKAAKMLREQNENNKSSKKESLLVTSDDLIFTNDRSCDKFNLLNNITTNYTQDQNKVCKQLLNNHNFQTSSHSTQEQQQNMEQQMHYLNLLFNKDTNTTFNRRRKDDDIELCMNDTFIGGDVGIGENYFDEDFQTESSSGEENFALDRSNLFTYTEKNFEEDDIMNIEHLRDAVTINIPESCKERKCRACFRRFMFEDSYTEHMNTCIEYKFLEYIEENCRLLALRRAKRISPHEFIRRMIFCLRKICEWLKKANCGDMLLPDLLQSSKSPQEIDKVDSSNNSNKEDLGGNVRKTSTASSSISGVAPQKELRSFSEDRTDLPKMRNKLTDLLNNSSFTTKCTDALNDNITEGNLFNALKNGSRRSNTATPITIENNILYEIERSNSRNSNTLPMSDLDLNVNVGQIGPAPASPAQISGTSSANYIPNDSSMRITFLQKLQKATNTQSLTETTIVNVVKTATPSIRVRKDLVDTTKEADFKQQSPTGEILLKPVPIITTSPVNNRSHGGGSFSARCKSCNLCFETVAALEVHNAMNHNPHFVLPLVPPAAKSLDEVERDAEHQRIISLFEEDDD